MGFYRMHKEGYKIVAVSVLLFFILAGGSYFFFKGTEFWWVGAIIVGSALLLLGLIFNFFRNPYRETPEDFNHVIAPCDGKVVAIEEVYEGKYFKKNMWQVSIFMSPLNVHVNRSPITGEVKFCEHIDGKYLVAWHPKSSTDNEHTFIVIQNSKMALAVKQVAGGVARRIKCYVKAGDTIKQGQEIGFIKFGSRMDILFPLECRIKVQLRDKTVGGETLIAILEDSEPENFFSF